MKHTVLGIALTAISDLAPSTQGPLLGGRGGRRIYRDATGARKMTGKRLAAAAILALGLPVADAQHAQPYSGQQARPIKALSDDETKQYLSGAGMGYARAAELNRFPGPMHVLELADKLVLTAEQRSQTETLMTAHKDESRRLGHKVVEAERALDTLFRSEQVAEQELALHVHSVARAQGEYRLSHLETHRRMRNLLTPQQIARYDQLRGYGAPTAEAPHNSRH